MTRKTVPVTLLQTEDACRIQMALVMLTVRLRDEKQDVSEIDWDYVLSLAAYLEKQITNVTF